MLKPESAVPLILRQRRKRQVSGLIPKAIKSLNGGWIGVEAGLGRSGQGCARLLSKVDKQHKITENRGQSQFQKLEMWADEHWWEQVSLD